MSKIKLGYCSGLASVPNDVDIALGTGASVGKKHKRSGWEPVPGEEGSAVML